MTPVERQKSVSAQRLLLLCIMVVQASVEMEPLEKHPAEMVHVDAALFFGSDPSQRQGLYTHNYESNV